MKILIVEDDSVSATLLKTILAPYGEIEVAPEGRKGLELWRVAAGSDRTFGLVCLDIMLPGMDGQAILREIRAAERAMGIDAPDSVPVVMVTALKDKLNVMGAFRSLCEAYIVKPIRRREVVEVVESLGIRQKA